MTDAELIALMADMAGEGDMPSLAELVERFPCRAVVRFGAGPVQRVRALLDGPPLPMTPDMEEAIAEVAADGAAMLILTRRQDWLEATVDVAGQFGPVQGWGSSR